MVHGEGWHPGVIGIVASRLAESYYRPTVVLSVDGDDGQGLRTEHPRLRPLRGFIGVFGALHRFRGAPSGGRPHLGYGRRSRRFGLVCAR